MDLEYNDLIEIRPHTLKMLRAGVDLDDQERRREAVDSLKDWIRKQDHFLVKEFSDFYLEWRLLTNGGSVEKAKLMIDRLCTLRTLHPQLFGEYNVRRDFAHILHNGISLALPKIMGEDTRVYVAKFTDWQHMKTNFVDMLRYVIVMAEYTMYHDYLNKVVVLFDFLETDLHSFIANMDFLEFKRLTTALLKGFTVKPQKILLMTESKLVNTLLALLKTILKPKIIQRIQVIRSHEELRDIVPNEILPKDYGGEEICFQELKEKWLTVLSSEKMLSLLKQISKERTDETRRSTGQFSEQYAGMEGTFRYLRVD